VWQFGTIIGESPNPALTGNYVFLNSDAYGNGNTQNADLITPVLDLSPYSSVTLQFNHYFQSYTGTSGTLSYSLNGGTSWTGITTFTTTSATNPDAFSQVIAAVAGQSNVKFKWNYTGTFGYYWGIDNIQITGVCSSTPPVGISVFPSSNPACAGTPVTFTAMPVNGGAAPAYQWKVNAGNAGNATNSTYTYIPASGDDVTCVLTSSAICVSGNPATSNTVAMTVNTVPAANFMAGDLTPHINDTVLFTDLSAGAPTAWNWSFDRPEAVFVNGTSAASQNPQVKFTGAGPYTLTLLASTAFCSDSEVKTAYLRAGTSGLWTGNVSSDWTDPLNWQNWLVPGAGTDVVIPPSAPNWPVFNGDLTVGTHCKSLILSGPGSKLTVTGNLIFQ